MNPNFYDFSVEEVTQEVKKLINDAVCKITFRKLNGELRVFEHATTKMEKIPADKQPTKNLLFDSEQVRVFDLDLQEWRSFKIRSLIQIDVLE